MIGIDTNVLLRWVAQEDLIGSDAPHQIDQVNELFESDIERLFVNHVVLVEAVWVLGKRAKIGKAAISRLVKRLLHADNIAIQDRDVVLSTLDAYLQYPGGFSDHLIGAINSQNGCRTTFTFDKAAARSPNFSELQR